MLAPPRLGQLASPESSVTSRTDGQTDGRAVARPCSEHCRPVLALSACWPPCARANPFTVETSGFFPERGGKGSGGGLGLASPSLFTPCIPGAAPPPPRHRVVCFVLAFVRSLVSRARFSARCRAGLFGLATTLKRPPNRVNGPAHARNSVLSGQTTSKSQDDRGALARTYFFLVPILSENHHLAPVESCEFPVWRSFQRRRGSVLLVLVCPRISHPGRYRLLGSRTRRKSSRQRATKRGALPLRAL